MPFLEDIGPRDERRGPVWSAFATIGGQVERIVAVNVVWSLVLVPALVALAFPELSWWLRLLLGLCSATALPPATIVLYGVASHASRGQHVDAGLVTELLRDQWMRGLRCLGPLYGTFGVLVWCVVLAILQGIAPLVTMVVLVTLLWSVCAVNWGPLVVAEPSMSTMDVLRESIRLAWRSPERTLATWLMTCLAVLVGTVSIGGLVLIVPILIAIVQVHALAVQR